MAPAVLQHCGFSPALVLMHPIQMALNRLWNLWATSLDAEYQRESCVGANAAVQLDARLIRFEGTSVWGVSVSSPLCFEPFGPHPVLIWKLCTHSWLESTWARAGLWPASFELWMSALTFPYTPNALLLSSSCWTQALELSMGFFKQICSRDSHHLS